MSEFGQVLRDFRGSLGLSQANMALQLGTTQRHLSFLETGRSAPTVFFLTRMCRELQVPYAQRSNLFTAAGLPQTYPRRDPTSSEVAAALDTIDARILAHWPFPAIVMDPAWTILRSNAPFDRMFEPFMPAPGNTSRNLATLMVQPHFRSMISNWSDVAELFYYRLQLAATRHAPARAIFAELKSSGLFNDMTTALSDTTPILTPVELRFPDGSQLRLTSLVGQLMAVQDPVLEGYEIELFVPLDQDSETAMLSV